MLELGNLFFTFNARLLISAAHDSADSEGRLLVPECIITWAILWALRHFRPYLAGRKFTVVTDHKTSRWQCEHRPRNGPRVDPTGRRARWTIELSTYDFVFVHRDGAKHTNADSLSRVPAATI